MAKHIRSSTTFHHRIARTSGIELDSRELICVLIDEDLCGLEQGFLISSVDLSNRFLLWSGEDMFDDFTGIDDKAICVHKFSSQLQSILSIVIFLKNLIRDEASRTVGNSIHRSKAEFHDNEKKNKILS